MSNLSHKFCVKEVTDDLLRSGLYHSHDLNIPIESDSPAISPSKSAKSFAISNTITRDLLTIYGDSENGHASIKEIVTSQLQKKVAEVKAEKLSQALPAKLVGRLSKFLDVTLVQANIQNTDKEDSFERDSLSLNSTHVESTSVLSSHHFSSVTLLHRDDRILVSKQHGGRRDESEDENEQSYRQHALYKRQGKKNEQVEMDEKEETDVYKNNDDDDDEEEEEIEKHDIEGNHKSEQYLMYPSFSIQKTSSSNVGSEKDTGRFVQDEHEMSRSKSNQIHKQNQTIMTDVKPIPVYMTTQLKSKPISNFTTAKGKRENELANEINSIEQIIQTASRDAEDRRRNVNFDQYGDEVAAFVDDEFENIDFSKLMNDDDEEEEEDGFINDSLDLHRGGHVLKKYPVVPPRNPVRTRGLDENVYAKSSSSSLSSSSVPPSVNDLNIAIHSHQLEPSQQYSHKSNHLSDREILLRQRKQSEADTQQSPFSRQNLKRVQYNSQEKDIQAQQQYEEAYHIQQRQKQVHRQRMQQQQQMSIDYQQQQQQQQRDIKRDSQQQQSYHSSPSEQYEYNIDSERYDTYSKDNTPSPPSLLPRPRRNNMNQPHSPRHRNPNIQQDIYRLQKNDIAIKRAQALKKQDLEERRLLEDLREIEDRQNAFIKKNQTDLRKNVEENIINNNDKVLQKERKQKKSPADDKAKRAFGPAAKDYRVHPPQVKRSGKSPSPVRSRNEEALIRKSPNVSKDNEELASSRADLSIDSARRQIVPVEGAAVGRGSYLNKMLRGRSVPKPKNDINEVSVKSNGYDDVSELTSLGIPPSSKDAKYHLNSLLPSLSQR